ncbi:MAG: hypothetical protein KF722_18005 [Nitrospira sp.]|nr:hypothetical protein [Nitrospira sp.]
MAQILAKIEERKAKEATVAEKAEAAKKLRLQRAKVLHKNDSDILVLSVYCEMKDTAIQNWERARTPEGRKRARENLKRGSRAILLRMEGPDAEYEKRLEREVDRDIDSLKRHADGFASACEKLKEADVLIAEEEQKKAEPLKRLRYWEDRLWKERFPNGHPAGAEAEAEALASPRK